MSKITIIFDNNKSIIDLQGGFGFSCLVEFENKKILFDTGGNKDVFFENIKKLNIDLRQITHAMFSHKHLDHIAGFEQVLKEIPDISPIFLPNLFPENIVKKISLQANVKILKSFTRIESDIYSLVLRGEDLPSETYEQSLILDTIKGIIVITGCAHPGIVNILKITQSKFPDKKIHLVMGGFHFYQSWFWGSAKAVQRFKELGVEKVAPCHCTGDRALKQFERTFNENFIQVGTGSIINI